MIFVRAACLFSVVLAVVPTGGAGEPSPPVEAVFDIENDVWVRRPPETSDRPYPAGSLFKLATAIAALDRGLPPDFEHVCTGGPSCWFAPGHGRLGLRGALAHSCSAYFAELASRIESRPLESVAEALGFEPGGRLLHPAAYAGDDPSLRIRPTRAALLLAFLAAGRPLNGRSPASEWARLEVRQALLDSVSFGTSSELQRYVPSAGAKTGTAYQEGGELIGWCAGFVPAHRSRYAFAVLVHGATSRQGAVPAAARLLRDLRWDDK